MCVCVCVYVCIHLINRKLSTKVNQICFLFYHFIHLSVVLQRTNLMTMAIWNGFLEFFLFFSLSLRVLAISLYNISTAKRIIIINEKIINKNDNKILSNQVIFFFVKSENNNWFESSFCKNLRSHFRGWSKIRKINY